MSDAPRKPPRLSSEPESAGPPDPPEAPPREFQFKPTAFARANRPGEAPIKVAQLYRAASAPAPAPAAPGKAENEVHAILRANLAADAAKGLNQVVLENRRPSRRKRDYWLVLAGGNVVFAGAMLLAHKNVVTLVFGFSGMVFFSIGLTWIMWAVLDDY
jgi:hypothetical protein